MGLRGERHGDIACQILINYKVDLGVLRRRLPVPFRPRSYGGYGLAGLTLMLIPPRRRWLSSHGLLLFHRIEAQAFFPGLTISGSYVVRGDYTGRWHSRMLGNFFPLVMHSTRLRWEQPENGCFLIEAGRREQPWLALRAHQGRRFPFDSIMPDLETANQFVSQHEAWFAPRYGQSLFEQRRWEISHHRGQPLLVDALDAPSFQKIMDLPRGTFFFDHALFFEGLEYRYTAPVELIAPRSQDSFGGFE